MTQTIVGEPFREQRDDRIHEELARILSTQPFSRSSRPGRFLTFLVERALTGEGDKINEYVLATEVFNRKPDFDPASDPIVRVEAGRLRRKLREYYNGEGQDSRIRIELPPRTYVPVFHDAGAPSVAAARPLWQVSASKIRDAAVLAVLLLLIGAAAWGTWERGSTSAVRAAALTPAQPSGALSLVVLPFTDLSPDRDQQYFCDGLRDEIADSLSVVEGLNVTAAARPMKTAGMAGNGHAAMLLQGSVAVSGKQIQIAVKLLDPAGAPVWSRVYSRMPKDALAIHEKIAGDVRSTLRGPQS